ncbi:hypothetical protein PQX77_017488, partial [Marasmius sp. AFHP31]
ISASTENAYWFDNKDECHWVSAHALAPTSLARGDTDWLSKVTLSKGSADNANNWFLSLVS